MKSWSRIVLAIVAVVGLVAGITFVKQYQVGGVDEQTQLPSPKPPTSTAEVKLNFPDGTIWEWKPPSAGQFEQQTKGYQDFWFQNDNPVRVILGLRSKSCKCSEVLVAVLPADEVKKHRNAINDAHGSNLNPQPLEIDDVKGVTVEKGAGGVVRLAWEDKKEKTDEDRNERLTVDLWVQAVEKGPKNYHHLELPVTYIPALRLDQRFANVGDLNLKEEKTAEFKCWSSTKQQFSLKAKAQREDPCFSCTCTPLTAPEQTDLEKASKSRVLCGYTVRVTVRERVSDSIEMELGPFSRRILLTSDPGIEPTSVGVVGVVRGDITVSTDEKGRIDLGPFPAKNGITKSVRLIAYRPGLELKLERVEPDGANHLKVKWLNKVKPPLAGGKSRWELCVEVPPGSPAGRLPDHAAVVLTIGSTLPSGTPSRQIRIPVTGYATQ
jgi:hypothetical protein